MATTDTAQETSSGIAVIEDLLQDFITWIVDYRRQGEATARAYERDNRRFIDWLRETGRPLEPEAIRPRDVRLFLSSLKDLAPATVRRTLYGISPFLGYLVDMEIIDRNPAAPVDPPKVERALPNVPTGVQCRRMLALREAPEDLRRRLADLLTTGEEG